MVNPFMFLVTPRKVYETMKLKPRWLVPFVVVVFGLVVKTFLSNSWGTQEYTFQVYLLSFYIFVSTFLVGVLWSAISTFLYLSMLLMNTHEHVTYKHVFALVSYCGMIILLGEISNYLLVSSNILNSMLYVVPKRYPMGLDIFTLGNNTHPALAIFLHSINPFSIWYFAVLSMGLSEVAGLCKTKARILSFIMWVIAVGLAMSMMMITGGTSLHIKL
jgi:hypothetical protein